MKEWLDHTVYEIVEEDGYLVAHILPSYSARITEMHYGYAPDEEGEFVKEIKCAHPKGCVRYDPTGFQRELNSRTTYTDEMWNMLFGNWTGRDLTAQWVYASLVRPISDVHIESTVGIIAPADTLYENRYVVHGYIVHPGPLDADTIRHYGLVFISKPEESMV